MRHKFSDKQGKKDPAFATISKPDGSRDQMIIWCQMKICAPVICPHLFAQ